jgi:hypothetical protein
LPRAPGQSNFREGGEETMVYALHIPTPQTPDGDRAALHFLLDRMPSPADRDADDDSDLTVERLLSRFPNL